jgi:hypothetical protein
MEQGHVAWGAASMLLKRHGADAPVLVATRIGELALAGDMDGVAMWKAIAVCMDQLMRTDGNGQQ